MAKFCKTYLYAQCVIPQIVREVKNMKVNIPQTRSVILICVLAFGILQHAASAADERQTLQALSKSFAVLAQEVGEVVVGIE